MNRETLPAALEVVLPVPIKHKWEREREAFRRLLPGLLATHRGQYVAIHEGQVIDMGTDPVELATRVLNQVGYTDIHVGLVADQPQAPIRLTKYREVRPQ